MGVSGWPYLGLSNSLLVTHLFWAGWYFSWFCGMIPSTILSMNLTSISTEMGSAQVIVQISLVAMLATGSLRPLTAEQMQAAAITDGGVWMRVGSGKNNFN